MAQKCAICGEEINVFQSQKLTDGNYICRKTCKKLGMKAFDYVHADLPMVLAHNAQVEEGTKIFNELFVPRMKTKEADKKLKSFGHVYVAPDLGLTALAEPEYKFFIFGKYWPRAVVYRTGDLYRYDVKKESKIVDGKEQTETFIEYEFANTPGMFTFREKVTSGEPVVKYFNSVFGIQKTVANAGNTFANQINAVKAAAGAVKAAMNGDADAEARTATAFDALNTAKYGDRTAINAKADAALAPYRK